MDGDGRTLSFRRGRGDRPRCQRAGIRRQRHAVDQDQADHNDVGQAAGKAEARSQGRRDRHDPDQDAPSAEAKRQLVTQHACRQTDDAEHGGNYGGAMIAGNAGTKSRIPEKRHEPGTHGNQLETMGAVGQDIAQRLTVCEDGAEIQQPMAFARRWIDRANAEPGDQQGGQRTQCQKPDTGAPAIGIAQQAGEKVGKADAHRIARGVEGDRARLIRTCVAIGQDLQARHVGAGKTDAAEGPPDQRGPETVGGECETQMRERAERRPHQKDAPRVEAVRQAHQEGYCHHVAEGRDPGDPAGLRVGDLPLADEERRQRGKREAGQQGPDLAHCHGEDEGAAGERFHGTASDEHRPCIQLTVMPGADCLGGARASISRSDRSMQAGSEPSRQI